MSDGSVIQWLQRPGTKPATLNPIRSRDRNTGKRGWYCEHVSEACRNCYAEALNVKPGMSGGTGLEYKPGWLYRNDIYLDEQTLLQPMKWQKPRTIFLCSMTDIFGSWVKDEWLDRIFAVAALCPQHTFIMLTKRPERMREYLSSAGLVDRVIRRAHKIDSEGGSWLAADRHIGLDDIFPLPNVWLGVTAEDQPNADTRIPHLLATPAAVRFVSIEPMLGPIDLTGMCNGWYFLDALAGLKYHDAPEGVHSATEKGPRLDWVICGGESGKGARPMHPDWVNTLRDQCNAAEVPFFMKQWGEWKPVSQMTDAALNTCYRSRRIAKPGQDQLDVDDVRSRRCLVDTTVLHNDGSQHDIVAPGAFKGNVGAMTMFHIGKKAAGRLLDGIEHNEFPRLP